MTDDAQTGMTILTRQCNVLTPVIPHVMAGLVSKQEHHVCMSTLMLAFTLSFLLWKCVDAGHHHNCFYPTDHREEVITGGDTTGRTLPVLGQYLRMDVCTVAAFVLDDSVVSSFAGRPLTHDNHLQGVTEHVRTCKFT